MLIFDQKCFVAESLVKIRISFLSNFQDVLLKTFAMKAASYDAKYISRKQCAKSLLRHDASAAAAE